MRELREIVVLASGSGSNLQALIDAIERGEIKNARIKAVISDRPNAYALERARKHGIPTIVIEPSKYGSREEYDRALMEAIGDVDLVLLLGFMRILGKEFVERYRGKCMNLHPALLPSFPGLAAPKKALRHGVKVSGATIHFVYEEVDQGPIIWQEPVRVEEDDTPATLHERIKKKEHEMLVKVVNMFFEGRLKIEKGDGRDVVRILPRDPVIMEGAPVAEEIKRKVAEEAEKFFKEHGIRPRLAAVLVGMDPASDTYVRIKARACQEAGMECFSVRVPESASEKEVLELIKRFNDDPSVHGIMVELPLPQHIDRMRVLSAIDPSKDVDGLNPLNLGNICYRTSGLYSCTAKAIVKLLDYYEIPLEGQHAVIVNDSVLIGRPLAVLLLNRRATVTICHDKTKNIEDRTREADILITAVGKRDEFLVRKDMVKDGVVVVDAGITVVEKEYEIEGVPRRIKTYLGDVDFEKVKEKARAITPVPGGVGPVTVACMLENLLIAAKTNVSRA